VTTVAHLAGEAALFSENSMTGPQLGFWDTEYLDTVGGKSMG